MNHVSVSGPQHMYWAVDNDSVHATRSLLFEYYCLLLFDSLLHTIIASLPLCDRECT